MPVPGGVGVTEAGYIAGLQAIGIQSTIALSTALAFRLVTFYPPTVGISGDALAAPPSIRLSRRHPHPDDTSLNLNPVLGVPCPIPSPKGSPQRTHPRRVRPGRPTDVVLPRRHRGWVLEQT